MAKQFLSTSNVKAFPAGFRKNAVDNSKTTTEENLTGLAVLSSDNSIRNRWIENPENENEYLIYIKGYKFIVTKTNVPSGYDYAGICLRTLANGLKVLGNLNDATEADLDVSNNFQGLAFYDEQPSEAGVYWVKKDDKLVITAAEIKTVAAVSTEAATKGINETFNTTTANITTGNITTINSTTVNGTTINGGTINAASGLNVTGNESITGNLSASGTVNGLNLSSSTGGGICIKDDESTNASLNIAAQKSVTINVPTTIGASSTNTGAVNIKSSGSNATTIIGPDNGTINLQANNAEAVDKVWAQNNGTNSWVQYTADATANTIVKRDANGDTTVRDLSARNITLVNGASTGTINGAVISKTAASSPNPAKLNVTADGASTPFGINIEDPAQLKIDASGNLGIDIVNGGAANTYIGTGVHVSLHKTSGTTDGITLGENSTSDAANPGVTLPLATTSHIGTAPSAGDPGDANKIVVTDQYGNINGAVTGEVGAATNVTTKINGNLISSIFETDGTTVKSASVADKVANALSFDTTGTTTDTSFDGSGAKTISYNSVGAAPTNHYNSAATYGTGDLNGYGHVKLVEGDLKNVSETTSGQAASSYHSHSQYLTGNQSITISGDASGTGTTTITLALEELLSSADSYGDASAQTPAYGGTFKVPYITVDKKGRITAISDHTVTIPASDNTDTLNTAGSTNSTSKLYLIGAEFQSASRQTYSNVNVYTQSGNLYCSQLYLTSDKRLKENEKIWAPEKSILDLPIYKYDFIEGPKNQIGCMAQDLKEICPEIVSEDEEGYLHISESKIVYLLLDEVKKLKQEIEELKRKGE